ncbi:hypothetical protein BELL_0926g00030 [Botrytis elliptica]|uniref:Uncharacterized protein n=1 Tax=Botrytis elliptica TaxID=278938 RepID=A0A4Z1IZZ4_9HELO|nr:hypothetical protein BELL_0926g00030 [Botrytis elliptica]
MSTAAFGHRVDDYVVCATQSMQIMINLTADENSLKSFTARRTLPRRWSETVYRGSLAMAVTKARLTLRAFTSIEMNMLEPERIVSKMGQCYR